MTGRSPSVVMADWLRNTRAGQWTPLEAAQALLAELRQEGYEVALTPDEDAKNVKCSWCGGNMRKHSI